MSTVIPGHQTAFEQDVSAYIAALPRLLGQASGKVALVARGELMSVHESVQEAMREGYTRFGLNGFLVQEVSKRDLEMGQHWLHSCPS